MIALQPLSGHPGTVRLLAQRLDVRGEHLLTLAGELRGLAGPDVVWESPSAEAFATRSRAAASLLESVGRRLGVSAAALRPLADALEKSQVVVDAAVDDQADAWPRAVALGTARVEAEQSADPAQRARAGVLHAQEIAQLERLQGAERRHAHAWRAFHEAGESCAEVLRGLLDDGLADPRTYDVLTALSRGAGGVADGAALMSLLPTPARAVTGQVALVAGSVQVVTDTTVKLTYGDGDWGSIGLSAAAVVTCRLGSVFKVGALATNPAAAAAATRMERLTLRFGTGRRVQLGFAHEVRQLGRSEVKRPSQVFRPTRAPGSPRATAHWLREQTVERARHAARVRWLDDLALATGDPARSRTLLLTGYGTSAASTGLDGGDRLRDLQLDQREEAEQQVRDERGGSGGPGGPPRPR